MTVITLRKARRSLRGRLTRWLLEVGPGVYVGTVSARVREQLWELVLDRLGNGAALMVFSARNEQGFEIWSAGATDKQVVDCGGLLLMMTPAVK